LTTPEGQCVPKSEILGGFRAIHAMTNVIQEVDFDEVDVRVYGDAAGVSSRFAITFSDEGGVEGPGRGIPQPTQRCVRKTAGPVAGRGAAGHPHRRELRP
jgi:hypothetical protein